jgi:hypothetical protein
MMKVFRQIIIGYLVLLVVISGCGTVTAKTEPAKTVETGPTDENSIVATQEKAAAQKQPAEEMQPSRTNQAGEILQAEDQQREAANQQAVDQKETVLQQAAQKETANQQAVVQKVTDPQQAAQKEAVNQQAVDQKVSDTQQAVQKEMANQQAANQVQTGADKQSQEQQQPQEDEYRVMATVDGEDLLAWQANQLMERGLASDLLLTVQSWITIKANAAESRRRGLDKTRENAFTLIFHDEYDLGSFMLENEIRKDIPEPAEEDIRREYQKNIYNYQQPMKADIQYISVLQKDLALKIYEEADKPGASFDDLVEKYSRADKAAKGRLFATSYEFLAAKLGPKVADAVSVARGMELLEPVMSNNGFVVIKVHNMVRAINITYEEVRQNISDRLFSQAFSEALELVKEDAKTKVKIVMSEEILKMDREALENAPRRTEKPPKVIK